MTAAPASAVARTVTVENDVVVPHQYRMQQPNFDNCTYTTGVLSVDIKDLEDVLLAADYVSDLFQHLHAAESSGCPGMYMQNQNDINGKVGC